MALLFPPWFCEGTLYEGEWLKDLKAASNGVAVRDGKGDSGNPAPGGIYLATVESGRNRKTLRLAVQR